MRKLASVPEILLSLLDQAISAFVFSFHTVLCLVLLMHQSLLVMLLAHKLQTMPAEPTIVPLWVLQAVVRASLVVNLATSRESALM
jgi:hypothetical protein